MAGIVLSRLLFDIQLPRCTNASSSSSNAAVASSGIHHCYPEWHNFPVIGHNCTLATTQPTSAVAEWFIVHDYKNLCIVPAYSANLLARAYDA